MTQTMGLQLRPETNAPLPVTDPAVARVSARRAIG
jgi:hypothetical protein